MAISKEIWEKIEVLAAKLGVAELALKYQRYGFPYPYMSKGEIERKISILRQEIHNIYEREKKEIIEMR